MNNKELLDKTTRERAEELKKFRTLTNDGYPTFDLEKYYDSLSTAVLEERLRATMEGLERYPNFGAKFYSDFADYLRKKITERSERNEYGNK